MLTNYARRTTYDERRRTKTNCKSHLSENSTLNQSQSLYFEHIWIFTTRGCFNTSVCFSSHIFRVLKFFIALQKSIPQFGLHCTPDYHNLNKLKLTPHKLQFFGGQIWWKLKNVSFYIHMKTNSYWPTWVPFTQGFFVPVALERKKSKM